MVRLRDWAITQPDGFYTVLLLRFFTREWNDSPSQAKLRPTSRWNRQKRSIAGTR